MFELLIGLLILAVALWRAKKLKDAMKAPVRDDICVACNSSNLSILGPNVYRCKECGYEGGSGVAALRDAARAKKVDAMSPEDRRAAGLKDLEEARILLLGCEGIMANAAALSRQDMLGFAREDGVHKQRELAHAIGEMMAAEKLVASARLKLGDTLDEAAHQAFEVDFASSEFFIDTAADNIFADIAVHSKIKKAAKRAEAMLNGVEGALNRVRAA